MQFRNSQFLITPIQQLPRAMIIISFALDCFIFSFCLVSLFCCFFFNFSILFSLYVFPSFLSFSYLVEVSCSFLFGIFIYFFLSHFFRLDLFYVHWTFDSFFLRFMLNISFFRFFGRYSPIKMNCSACVQLIGFIFYFSAFSFRIVFLVLEITFHVSSGFISFAYIVKHWLL